jgi:transcriptional regulator with XRE-family HTH domain
VPRGGTSAPRRRTPSANTTGSADLSDELVAIGARIRELRLARGLRQAEVAGDDISVAYVSRIEAGQRRADTRVLAVIAERLGTTPEQLLTGRDPEDDNRLVLALRYAEIALRTGELAEAERQLLDLPAEQLRGQWRDDAQALLAATYEAQGRLTEAAELYERLGDAADGPRWLHARIGLCRCYREVGDLARAIDVGEQAQAQLAERGLAGLDEALQLTLTMAAAYFERGDVFHAARLCQQVVAAADERGTPALRGSAYWNASVIAYNQGDHHEAVRLAEKALALFGEGDDARNLSRLRLQLGTSLLAQDPPAIKAAEAQLNRARLELVATGAGQVDLARCDADLAHARLLSGDLDEAERLAEQSMAEAVEAPLALAHVHALRGRIAAARGDEAAARASYRSAVAALTGASADREAAQLWYQLGAELDEVGDGSGACDAYRRAGASMGLRASAVVPAGAISEGSPAGGRRGPRR